MVIYLSLPTLYVLYHKLSILSLIDEVQCLFDYRVGKYKLIQGSPGGQNGWTPVPTVRRDIEVQERSSGPQHFPPYQLFDIDGKAFFY